MLNGLSLSTRGPAERRIIYERGFKTESKENGTTSYTFQHLGGKKFGVHGVRIKFKRENMYTFITVGESIFTISFSWGST